MIPLKNDNPHKGFALLVSVIFMAVMLALGLSLASLGYKQQVLASSATESQQAFYVADAALECALYYDQQQNLFAFNPDPMAPAPSMPCSTTVSAVVLSRTVSQWVISSRITYPDSNQCADVTIYKPTTGTTYIFSQGYDVPCSTVASPSGARFVSRGIDVKYTSS